MRRLSLLLLLWPVVQCTSSFAQSPLTFEERVKAQEAIERVYYAHRVWPKENPKPKPPFEEMVPRAVIEEKVTEYLKKSAALGEFWQRPLTAEQLQAEMDRMARHSKDPATLKELFAALRNDPHLIAECLARPTLSDRLARSWYASDDRFHGELKARVEALRRTLTLGTFAACREGEFSRVKIVCGEKDRAPLSRHEETLTLPREEFAKEAARFPRIPGQIGLEETDEAFVLRLTVAGPPQPLEIREGATLEGMVLVFRKGRLDDWMAGAVMRGSQAESCEAGSYRVPEALPTGMFLPDSWTQPGWNMEARRHHTAVWTGSEMIIWGGLGGTYLIRGGRYNPTTDTWAPTSTGTNVPCGRWLHTAVWTGSEMIVWGGYWDDGSPHYENSGGRYNPVADTWVLTSTGANVPSARCQHSAVWTGSLMIVWGGDNPSFLLNSGGRYDPLTDTWMPTSTDAATCPRSRNAHGAVWTGEEMIVYGGHVSGFTNTGGRYDPVTDTWSPTSTGENCPSVRETPSVIWTGTEMIVWGGVTGSYDVFLNTGGRYDPRTDTWLPTSTGLGCPSGRVPPFAVWTGSEMIVWGGHFQYPMTVYNTGGRYNPRTDSWTPTSTGPHCPIPRTSDSAVWTGSEMIIWGGYEWPSFIDLNSGGRYNPQTDSWAPTSMVNASCPSSRSGQSAVWTGAEMIVWGGGTDSGGRYNPATDAWTPTAVGIGVPNVPSARSGHTAIWSGLEMIVWGGGSDTGGRYSPQSDTWLPTSVGDHVPAARSGHTAIWSGSEMIVWGGSGLNTGGRYDPSHDTWAETSTGAGVPGGRSGHTAIWSGSEMVIWGGSGLNTGGRYDALHDTWSATSTDTGVPSGRSGHTAVWTGTDMVIWGGDDGAAANTGGVYDPVNDDWDPVSTGADCPSARSLHTAVWTGREMIVWGGLGSSPAYKNDGGRYDPQTDTWKPTSGVGAPSARQKATAVWTGQQMIVWGGAPNSDTGIYLTNTPPTSLPSILNADSTIHTGQVPAQTLQLTHTLPAAWWDDAESDDTLSWWSASGPWHRVFAANCSGASDYFSPSHAWYFGDSTSCSYAGAGGTYSLQAAQPRSLEAGTMLTFRYFLSTDRQSAIPAHDTPAPIPDNSVSGATSFAYVPSSAAIQDLNVRVDISHTYVGNLTLYLTGPDGTQVALATHLGGDGDGFANTLFDDEATTPISSGTPPFAGVFQPEQALSAFDGKGTAGRWQLQVVDDSAGDSGTILSWSLYFTTGGANGDVAAVEVSSDGASWVRVATDASHWGGPGDGMALEDACTSWHAMELAPAEYLYPGSTPPAGATFFTRFSFTRDGLDNTALGWLLDDIGIGEPSGDGSNPCLTASDSIGSDPQQGVPYHDAWDRATFEWDLNGDGMADNPDWNTPVLNLPEVAPIPGDPTLATYGLDVPGDHLLTLRVTDSLGLADTQTVTLHVLDGIPPTTSLVTPNGGETWDYSPDTSSRKTHMIFWNHWDNFPPLGRIKLSYTTDGTNWTCIADTKTPGGDCAAGALTPESTSFLWTMPTQAEAAASVPPQVFPSSTARVRVEVWDLSGNRAVAASADPFYIIQPTSTSVQTLILTNTDRIGDSAAVLGKLLDLAARDQVNGAVLDLKIAGLSTLYSDWDLDPTNVSKANAVADGVRNYLILQVQGTYTSAKYLVLAGDDHVIPFYRVADLTATFPEHPNYDAQVDCLSPVGAAICQNYYLTDAVFGDLEYTDTDVGSHFIALPDLATGRLVETPEEIMDTVDAFISQDGQVNLNEVLVTGYDFLEDCAAHVRNDYNQAGKTVDLLNGASWTSGDLETQLFSSPPHAIHNLNDHSNHFSIGTPSGVVSSSTIDAHGESPFVGTLFYSLGCHSGLNVPGTFAEPLDLPEVALKRGAAAYVGNTGFGWGLRNGIGYNERLMELLTEHLLGDSNGVFGDALASAKREYFLENHRYDVFDEKTLFQSTLYGLPMYRVVVNPTAQAPQKPELHAEGPDEQEAEGIRLVKSQAFPATQEALPPTLTELTMNFTFGESTYAKVNVPGTGDYYTLNGRCNGEIGDSLQPMFVFDSRLSDTVNHGVVFLGGHYLTETGFTPVVAVPQSSNLDVGAGPIAPGMGSLIGVISRTQAPQGQTFARAEASTSHLTRLTVYTGAYDSGTERHFDQMRFALYYSNETDTTEPVITDPGLDPAALHTLDGMTARFSVQASDASGIYRVMVAYTEPTSDPQGNWVTFDLAYNAGTGRWEGDLALKRDITYFAQAVDNAGNVSYLTLTGPDIDGHGQPTGSTYKTARLFSIHLADTDGDGMPDAWETPHGLNPAVNDAGLDPDLDGLSNGGEFSASTDPQNADTDGDGDNDGSELSHGRNPLNPVDGKRITIALTKVGDDVQIDWPTGNGDNGIIDGPYWVYRSADPFFGPGELLNPPPGQVPTGTQTYTDVGGGTGPLQFYVVTNARYTGPAPTVDAVVPGTGPMAGGTTVSIYGSDFVSGATVSVGGNPCANTVFVNSTKITCTAPAGSGGAKDVTVTNPNGQFGTLTGGYVYY